MSEIGHLQVVENPQPNFKVTVEVIGDSKKDHANYGKIFEILGYDVDLTAIFQAVRKNIYIVNAETKPNANQA